MHNHRSFCTHAQPVFPLDAAAGNRPLNLEDLPERVLALNCLRLVSLMPWIFEARFEERDLIRHEELGRA